MSDGAATSGMLAGQVAIVSGGASGMGAATCRLFAREGAIVAVADINAEGAAAVADEIRGTAGEAVALEVDIASFEQVEQAVRRVLDEYGRIDVLVNSAAVSFFTLAQETTPEQWRSVQAVNLDGTWHMCRAVMPAMIRARSGKIVNIGAGAGLLGVPEAAHYSTSKHAVVGLTRSLAVDLGPHGINVNCVAPGTVPGTTMGLATVSPAAIEGVIQRTPLRRVGVPEDIANAVLFLVSLAADWITGVVLPVDGGLTCCIRAQHYG